MECPQAFLGKLVLEKFFFPVKDRPGNDHPRSNGTCSWRHLLNNCYDRTGHGADELKLRFCSQLNANHGLVQLPAPGQTALRQSNEHPAVKRELFLIVVQGPGGYIDEPSTSRMTGIFVTFPAVQVLFLMAF